MQKGTFSSKYTEKFGKIRCSEIQIFFKLSIISYLFQAYVSYYDVPSKHSWYLVYWGGLSFHASTWFGVLWTILYRQWWSSQIIGKFLLFRIFSILATWSVHLNKYETSKIKLPPLGTYGAIWNWQMSGFKVWKGALKLQILINFTFVKKLERCHFFKHFLNVHPI